MNRCANRIENSAAAPNKSVENPMEEKTTINCEMVEKILGMVPLDVSWIKKDSHVTLCSDENNYMISDYVPNASKLNFTIHVIYVLYFSYDFIIYIYLL